MKIINRIKSSEDFVSTIKKGRTLKNNTYIIHFRNNELNACRVGISVSKKLGNAVTRNRIKRQVRAMCDSLICYSDHTIDIVIVVKDGFLKGQFIDNKLMLSRCLGEIGITQ